MAPPSHISLMAGMIAGGIEGFITYPTEYVKTQLQLQNNAETKRFKGPIDCLVKTVREKGVFGLYKGMSALVIGNSMKAGVRFLTFDQTKRFFEKDGKVSGFGMMVSGLAAGISEAVLVVTPSETIKTKLIHDQNAAQPRFKGLWHGTSTIIKEEGIAGIYRGLTAVVARQGANSAVRMTTYGLIREELAKYYPVQNGKPVVPWTTNFLVGAFAGIVTVYCTMPLDTVKTRMQALDAKQRYKNTLDCLIKVGRTEGITALWKGATPRLGRLIFSGGIVFTVYEAVVSIYEGLNTPSE
ncbi:mitochondrial carrier domain-containing protein [Gorgonomyces haynaldii]|nr:mitochondrial carrier domain-containing protein [Gorgonomyces haynaldii]